MKITKREIAECVGLWLAEGDNKTRREVTFTNNCFVLIQFFHNAMVCLYDGNDFRPRLYSYSKDGKDLKKLNNVLIKNYFDLRAKKPYYIYRFASIKLISNWKNVVKKYLRDHGTHIDILRGFFAGEGNIKVGTKGNRVVRIAQKHPVRWVDDLLVNLGLKFSFDGRGRSYSIWSRDSWDKLAEIRIADLHPDKRQRFLSVYNQFREYHYSNNFLKDSVYNKLISPINRTTLSKIFNRSPDRLSDVLIKLKKENKIDYFKVRSEVYWVRNDQDTIVISSVKQKYLNLLNKPKTTEKLARENRVGWKSSYRRLRELENLRLVKRREDKHWVKVECNKKIIVK